MRCICPDTTIYLCPKHFFIKSNFLLADEGSLYQKTAVDWSSKSVFPFLITTPEACKLNDPLRIDPIMEHFLKLPMPSVFLEVFATFICFTLSHV